MPDLAAFAAFRPAVTPCHTVFSARCDTRAPEIYKQTETVSDTVTPATPVTPQDRSSRAEIDRLHVAATTGEAASWRSGLVSLDPHSDPCAGFRHWPSVQREALRFVEDRGEEAAALGWTTLNLFGVHREAGAIRVDQTGALITLWGKRVGELTPDLIRFADGLAYRRRSLSPAVSCPVWEFRPSNRSAVR